MISGVFGLTGAGKSSFLAWCASRAQRGKRLHIGFGAAGGVWLQDESSKDYDRIYSNFPLKGCFPLDWDLLGTVDYNHCLILIDEIMMLCDSRAWKSYPEHIKYFFSHHRHYHIDVVWCSQAYKDCDLRIRNLCGQFLRMRKAGAFTQIIPIHHYQDVRNGVIDDWYEPAATLGTKYFLRKPLYHMFDSHSTLKLPPVPDCNMWEV